GIENLRTVDDVKQQYFKYHLISVPLDVRLEDESGDAVDERVLSTCNCKQFHDSGSCSHCFAAEVSCELKKKFYANRKVSTVRKGRPSKKKGVLGRHTSGVSAPPAPDRSEPSDEGSVGSGGTVKVAYPDHQPSGIAESSDSESSATEVIRPIDPDTIPRSEESCSGQSARELSMSSVSCTSESCSYEDVAKPVDPDCNPSSSFSSASSEYDVIPKPVDPDSVGEIIRVPEPDED
ncbi:hypothetical protein FOZ63_016192, partial [Perkinsus olseni]